MSPITERASLVAPSVSVATSAETLGVLVSFVNDLGPVLAANLALIARAARVGALEPILADGVSIAACPAEDD